MAVFQKDKVYIPDAGDKTNPVNDEEQTALAARQSSQVIGRVTGGESVPNGLYVKGDYLNPSTDDVIVDGRGTSIILTDAGSNLKNNPSYGTSCNVFIGQGSSDSAFFANGCTHIGCDSGSNIQNAIQTTFIGQNSGQLTIAGDPLQSPVGVTCIGVDSRVSGNSQLQLGKSGITTYAYGSVQDRSDERDKADIKPIELGLDFIMKVKPIMYRWDYREDYVKVSDDGSITKIEKDGSKKGKRFHCGVSAQQIKSVIDEIGIDFAGYQDHSINGGDDVKSIGYQEFIPILIKAVQDLSKEIELIKPNVTP